MFTPEYTITSEILRNIAAIEYAKAIVDSTTILENWENQLKKEAQINTTYFMLQSLHINISQDLVKKSIENLIEPPAQEIDNITACMKLVSEISKNKELDELDIKYLQKTMATTIVPKSKQGTYRSLKVPNKVNPEEILAEMVKLYDWLNSLDAKEAHPIIIAAIAKAKLEEIMPFENFNPLVSDFMVYLLLKINGYDFKGYLCLESYYFKTKRDFDRLLENTNDLTKWIEYFTQGFSLESSSIQERVKLLYKDTQVAKATGRIKLTPRQQRLVEYLQDYGILQNKDFGKVFVGISEDSVLRDLKALIDHGIVIKAGSTKSSRYELK